MYQRYLLLLLPGFLLAISIAGCRPSAPRESGKVDTPDNRLKAARQYVIRVPPSGFVDGAIKELTAQREPSQREAFQQLLKRELRERVIEETIVQALVKHFTVEEINALAEFNSSPQGLGVQRKLTDYMADVLPPVQQEISRVISMTNAATSQLRWHTRLIEANASIVDEALVGGFTFVNQGVRPVNILSVTSPCACMSGIADRTNYPPQQGGVVRVRFEFGPRVGLHSKYVTVHTDDPSEPSVRLQMDILIPEIAHVEPLFSRWIVGAPATTQVHRVTLLHAGTTVEGIECSNTVFRSEWQGKPSGNGEVRVTPASTDRRTAGQLDILVRVATNVVRRIPVFLAISSDKKQ